MLNKIEEKSENNSETSDSDEYINVADLVLESKNNIYQIQLWDKYLVISKIGEGSHAPEIIIKENFGPQNNLFLYSCVYLEGEIISSKTDDKKFLPIIKLVEKNEVNKISSICIILYSEIKYDIPLYEFDTVFTQVSEESDYILNFELDKNINTKNVVEKLFEYVTDIQKNNLL
jgi:hypothetical protein